MGRRQEADGYDRQSGTGRDAHNRHSNSLEQNYRLRNGGKKIN